MENRRPSILLITSAQALVFIINCCWQSSDVLSREYELVWLGHDLEAIREKLSSPQRFVLLVDESLFPQVIAKFSSLHFPIVVLANDRDSGLKSLELGANDYLDTSDLNHLVIERSLRLALQLHSRSYIYENNQNQTFYQDFFDNSLDGLFSLNLLPNSSLVYGAANESYARIMGTTCENIVGKKITDVL